MENSGKIIGGLLLGAAVGTTLGVLLAPNKGNKTRKELFNNAKDLADDWKEKVSSGIDKFVEELSNLKFGAEKIADDSKKITKAKASQT